MVPRPPEPTRTARFDALVLRLRTRRGAHLAVVVLRLLLGFAFLPAGIKKVLGQPFTDPDRVGPFHDFLRAFHDTGGFYRFVGVVQLVAATLLLTQRHATLGAAIALPVVTAIVALCWSTHVVPTAIVATLMWCGISVLLLWDRRPRLLIGGDRDVDDEPTPRVDEGLWSRCGAAILVLYLALTALSGEVYRPRRIELDRPQFYLLVALPLLPLVTWILERRRRVIPSS